MTTNVKLIEERPENAEAIGWVGPGWYWVTGDDVTGPFGSEAEALADLQAYEDWLRDSDMGYEPWDGEEDEGYDPEDDR